MRSSIRPFRRLQWQLSLSYTLVAVGALLVVELLLIGGGLLVLNSNMLPGLLTRTFRDQFSVALRPFLDQPEPDLDAIARVMSAYQDEVQQAQEKGPDLQLWSANEASENFFLLSPDGRLLWSEIEFADLPVGQPLDPALIPGLEAILPAALANAPEPERLYTRTGDLLTIAAPILNQDGQRVLGVMVILLRMPSFTNPQFLAQLLPPILISVALFTLAAGLVGSVFGYFTARRLTRRLGHISTAAGAWSRGDFSSFITEPGADELGDLAQRLNLMAEQLQNLLDTRQHLAAAEERNRIARELHDSVKQQVFATSMQLGAARALLPETETPAGQHLEEAERLTRQAQAELNALIRELRPVALEGKGLAGALRELVADWSRVSGIAARFEESSGVTGGDAGGKAAPALPFVKEQALYRVAQEALSNAARHSGARTARVTLTRAGQSENGHALLTIQDDGQGFDPALQNGAGMGLRSMRERIEALGGTLTIETGPGNGTRITVQL